MSFSYGDLFGLAFFVLMIGLGLFALYKAGSPRKKMTNEEFEKRVREGPGLLNAGIIGLQKIIEPGVAKAVETQQKLKQGRYNSEQGSGEGYDPEEEAEHSNSPQK